MIEEKSAAGAFVNETGIMDMLCIGYMENLFIMVLNQQEIQWTNAEFELFT